MKQLVWDTATEQWHPAPASLKIVEVWGPPNAEGAVMVRCTVGRGRSRRMRVELLKDHEAMFRIA